MYVLQKAKQQILKDLKNAIGKEFTPSLDDLTTPPDSKMGDITFPCFELAKAQKKNPAELARELAAKMAPKALIKEIASSGPYVNFKLDDEVLGKQLLENIHALGASFGVLEASKKQTKIMVEYANINTHKMIHIGHLRNFFVGQSVINLLRANGHTVIPVYYINDLGMHVASVVWAHEKYHKSEDPPVGTDKIEYLGNLYTEAVNKIEGDPELKQEVSRVFQVLEKGRGPECKLWKKTRKWSLEYIHGVYKELGLEIQEKYYESDLICDTRKIIEDLIKKGIVTHSEGAWIVDLKKEGLGVNLLVKSDKTLLYNAKDLALAFRKEKEFQPTRSIYVVDGRQSHALAQLFATLKLMKFNRELVHLSYEFVTLEDGAMSSRRGNIMRYEAFRDAMIAMAIEETKKRHADWSDKKTQKIAHTIAFAAIRFTMLKQDLEKQITFNMQEALSFDGFTGPYLLYTQARLHSLLRRGKKIKMISGISNTSHSAQHKLLALLASFPDVVFTSGQTLRVSVIAQYLFDLCKTFAEYYEQVPILQEGDETGTAKRLALVDSVRQVLENGLKLLGIEGVDEM